MRAELTLLIAVFAAVSGLAALFGSPNAGTAMTFGQIAFAITVVLLMVRRGRDNRDA